MCRKEKVALIATKGSNQIFPSVVLSERAREERERKRERERERERERGERERDRERERKGFGKRRE